MHSIHSVYTFVDEDATGGAMTKRKLFALVVSVSWFGDSQSVGRLAPGYHHTHRLPALPSARERQAASCTAQTTDAACLA